MNQTSEVNRDNSINKWQVSMGLPLLGRFRSCKWLCSSLIHRVVTHYLSNGEVLLLFRFLEWIIQFVFKSVLLTLPAWGFQCRALQNISFSSHLRKPKDCKKWNCNVLLCVSCVTFVGFSDQRRADKDFSHVLYHISELRCGFHAVIIYHSITLHPVMCTAGSVCFRMRVGGVHTVHPFCRSLSIVAKRLQVISFFPENLCNQSFCLRAHRQAQETRSRWKWNVHLCHIP